MTVRQLTIAVLATSLLGCTPKEEGEECGCGILQFENMGPAEGTCRFIEAEGGDATLESLTGEPKFKATLKRETPPAKKERVWTAYTASIDLECEHPWCKGTKTEVPVLRVEHLDGYRATVVRSAEGPPDQVLHLSCPSKN